MEPSAIKHMQCSRCSARIHVDQCLCPQCGLDGASGDGVGTSDQAPSLVDTVDRPWVICILLFGVTGALGIPILWMSRSISLQGKIVLTVTVILYTLLLVFVTWLIVAFAWSQIRQFDLF